LRESLWNEEDVFLGNLRSRRVAHERGRAALLDEGRQAHCRAGVLTCCPWARRLRERRALESRGDPRHVILGNGKGRRIEKSSIRRPYLSVSRSPSLKGVPVRAWASGTKHARDGDTVAPTPIAFLVQTAIAACASPSG